MYCRSITSRLVSSACVLTVVVSASSCTGGSNGTGVVVRDSAGVTIVENYEGVWSEGEGWYLSEEPAVTIGMEDGPEEYSLFEVSAALRLPDGRIVIANNGTDELRYYDSLGTHLYSVGNDGYGPGEFKIMRGTWLVRDSLIINDRGQDRVSVFSAAGEYGRTVMLHREPGSIVPMAVGVFSDGSMLGLELVIDRHAVPEPGMSFRRMTAVLRRYSRDGDLLDSLGVFFISEAVSEMLESRTDAATGIAYGSSVTSEAPFGRAASWIAFEARLYYGSSDSYEIQIFSKDGTLERIFRRPIPNEPVTASDIEAFHDYFVGDDPRYERWARRRVNELEFPETKPAYGSVKVDALGNVWVAAFSLGHNDRSGEWTVFDPDGRMLGVVQVPVGGRIRDISENYLIGMWRTELDVEQVKMYRLFRD